jgi:hypothetical protein
MAKFNVGDIIRENGPKRNYVGEIEKIHIVSAQDGSNADPAMFGKAFYWVKTTERDENFAPFYTWINEDNAVMADYEYYEHEKRELAGYYVQEIEYLIEDYRRIQKEIARECGEEFH